MPITKVRLSLTDLCDIHKQHFMHICYTKFCPTQAVNMERTVGNVFPPVSIPFNQQIFLNLMIVRYISVDMRTELCQNHITSAKMWAHFRLHKA